MKKQNLKKMITMGLIATSLITVAPMKANAEWKKDSKGWWYAEGNSYLKNSWKEINGKWYYFDYDGYMQKGWLYTYNEDSGIKYYYFNDDGSMFTGTKEIDGVEYRFNLDGTWAGHTDEEIEKLLNKEVKKGNSTIVYDESDDTDYSKFTDGFYTKEFIENHEMIERNFMNRYSSFEDEIIRISANSASADDIVYIQNHKKVLNGLVGEENRYYYMENGHFVRNSWVKLNDKYIYFNAAGSSANNMVDGFSTLGEKLGINRGFPYNKENNSERTYYVRSYGDYNEDREFNEDEFNKAVNNGEIVFQAMENIKGTGFGNNIGLNYFSGKKKLINDYKKSWGLK